MSAAVAVAVENLDKDQMKTVRLRIIESLPSPYTRNITYLFVMVLRTFNLHNQSARRIVLRLPAVLQQAVRNVFRRLHQRFHRSHDQTGRGQVRAELHGEIPENEPADIATLPGIPDGRQRECAGNGPENRADSQLDRL